MNRLFLTIACLLLLTVGTFADKEYEDHSHDHHHHHHHHGHDHHEHDFASHADLFSSMTVTTVEEQHAKLRNIVDKIDIDRDDKVSRDEMRDYVQERIKEQHAREADDFISTIDPKHTNKITWDAYVKDNYGDLDIKQLESANKFDPSSRETRRTYQSDKEKWTHLDKDGDQSLSHEEFRKFLRPEDDEELRHLEITSIIKEYDDNNDGKISNEEYLKMTEAETGQSEPLGDEIDINQDGFGDYEEFARYYLPTSSLATDEETDHLLKECDKDKDDHCSVDEILEAYATFASSQITDFGADLDLNKEEL